MKLLFLISLFCTFCLATGLSNAMLYESQMIFVIDATIYNNDTSIVNNLYATNGTYYEIPYPNGNYAVKMFSDGSLIYEKQIIISFVLTGTNITTDTVKTIM